MNIILSEYIGSVVWPISAAVLAVIAYLFSDSFNNLRIKLSNNRIVLEDESIFDTLIRHMGEIGLVLLFIEKVNSTTKLEYKYKILNEVVWAWSSIQLWLVLLLISVSLYSYGRLAIVFGNRDESAIIFVVVLIISAFTFILLHSIK